MLADSSEIVRAAETQHINCNLCGKDDADQIVIQNGYRMVECRRCGLVYADPRPTPELLKELYNSYHERGSKNESTWQRLMASNFGEVAAMLAEMLPNKGALLDIGCGYGHFIGLMKQQGWAASGIEPSETTCRYAGARGLDVSRTVIEDASFPDSAFDAITAFYVLEHIFDPLAALKKIRAFLKPDGVLVLRLPHTTPVVKALRLAGIRNNLYDLPFHLYDFSPATITRMLWKAGFADIKIVPGHPTSPPDPVERLIASSSGKAARLIYSASGGKILLPGVSKTITARKPAEMSGEDHA